MSVHMSECSKLIIPTLTNLKYTPEHIADIIINWHSSPDYFNSVKDFCTELYAEPKNIRYLKMKELEILSNNLALGYIERNTEMTDTERINELKTRIKKIKHNSIFAIIILDLYENTN